MRYAPCRPLEPSTPRSVRFASAVAADAPALWNELRRVQPGRIGVFAVQMDEYRFLERPLYKAGGIFNGFDAGWCHASRWTAMRLGPRFFCIDMGGFAFSSELLWGHLKRDVPKPWDYRGVCARPRLALAQPAAVGTPLVRRWYAVGALPRSEACFSPTQVLKYMPLWPKRKRWRRAVLEWRGGESEFLQTLLPNGFPEDLQPLGNCGLDVLVYHNGYLAKTAASANQREAHAKWEQNVHVPHMPCKEDGW